MTPESVAAPLRVSPVDQGLPPMEPIYLDHAAATPLRPEARKAMDPWLTGVSGNPQSIHRWGRAARESLEDARERIARTFGATSSEVIFTRGGTESANLAVLGRLEAVRTSPSEPGSGPPLFVYSSIEHSAVREAMAEVEARGARITTLPVSPRGEVDEAELDRLLARRPVLLSVQWVNQETGLILPIDRIAARCREAGVPLHVDGVQAGGRLPIDLAATPIDMLTLSAHKMGGPRGMGALVVREKSHLRPRLFGGGQEQGLRPGTGDVAGAVGFAAACEAMVQGMETEGERLGRLRDLLEDALSAAPVAPRVHGGEGPRAPHILGLGFPSLPRDLLPGALDLAGVGVSAGSACRSGSTAPSPVLTGLYGDAYARTTAPLRISLGWSTTESEVKRAIPIILETLERVRSVGV